MNFFSFPRSPLFMAVVLAFSTQVTQATAADKELGVVFVSSKRSVGAKPVLRDEIVTTESLDIRN